MIARWRITNKNPVAVADDDGIFVLHTDHVAHTAALVQALSWALDLLDMYDEKLIGLGEPSAVGQTARFICVATAKARAALDGQP